jgi:AsmA protein
MSVSIRRTAIALAVGALVLAAGAVWLVTGFDPADHKGVAIEWVKARYDRTLAIDGPITLSLFPRLEIRLRDVALSEAGRSDPFASVDEASLSVELLPLLRRRLSVDRVEARGVRLVLLRDAKGRRNIDDLLRPAPRDASSTGRGLQFDVRRILLSNVQARVKDEQDGIDGELVLKDLSTGRIESQVESGLQLVAQFGF